MKKSLILAGMLCIGYASAQEYDGKVGINTEEPKATLDIRPEATNLTGTTNEGIIAPRLSKTRIANIEASKLTEGTLVYASDAVYVEGADTAKNSRVAKIDEKGYYFYNGTEWVKVQYKDTNTNNAEWVYDDATKRINLKRSGQNTGFVNKVYYNAQTGQFFNIQNDSFNFLGETINVDGNGIYNLIQKETPSITANVTHGNTKNYKTLQNLIFNVNEPSALASFRPSGLVNQLRLLETNKSTSYWVQATNNSVVKSDDTTTNYIMGGSNSLNITNGDVSGYATATRSETYINNSKEIKGSVRGITSFLSTGPNHKSAKDLMGIYNNVSFGNSTVNNMVTEKVALYSGNFDYRTFNPKIPMLVGYYYGGTIVGNTSQERLNTEAHYGIYLEDVTRAKSNYAIYSNAGKIRFGDLSDSSATADRAVVVDKDGVLKIGTATASNTGVKANTTTETCSDANLGAIHFKEVEISGTSPVQKKGVFGFCTKQNNTAMWVYLSNGGNIMQGTGTFGQGL